MPRPTSQLPLARPVVSLCVVCLFHFPQVSLAGDEEVSVALACLKESVIGRQTGRIERSC